jgi:hypothetical protein
MLNNKIFIFFIYIKAYHSGDYLTAKKIVVPQLSLKKFYKICAFRNTTPESINLSEKTFNYYIKFRNQLFGNHIKAETFDIFIDILRKKILSEIISNEELAHLENKPLNPNILKRTIESLGKEISNTSSKRLLSLLIKINLLDQVNVIKNLSYKNHFERDKELLYYYILRRKDFLKVKALKEKFKDHPRKHKINEYLLDLWMEEKIKLDKLDVPIIVAKENGIENIQINKVKDLNSIELYRIRESGELRARIVIQDDYKIYPINQRG